MTYFDTFKTGDVRVTEKYLFHNRNHIQKDAPSGAFQLSGSLCFEKGNQRSLCKSGDATKDPEKSP